MKRAIIKALNEIESQLSGQSAVATYSYMMLCVKAEEMALLPVSINIEGEEKYIEEVASVVKPDDYTFIVIPHFDEDLVAVCQGSDRAAGAGRPRFRGRYRAERRPHDACREVLRQGMTQGADKK